MTFCPSDILPIDIFSLKHKISVISITFQPNIMLNSPQNLYRSPAATTTSIFPQSHSIHKPNQTYCVFWKQIRVKLFINLIMKILCSIFSLGFIRNTRRCNLMVQGCWRTWSEGKKLFQLISILFASHPPASDVNLVSLGWKWGKATLEH